jgi:hypothetical protein
MTEKNHNPWKAEMWKTLTLSGPKSQRMTFTVTRSEYSNPWVGADHDIVKAGHPKVITIRK